MEFSIVFFANITVQTLLSLFRVRKLHKPKSCWSIPRCFALCLTGLLWITLWNTSNSQTNMHPSRELTKRGEILPMFVEILLIYAAANIELRNCEIFTQVGENLIFLFTPIYFIVGFGRHSEL